MAVYENYSPYDDGVGYSDAPKVDPPRAEPARVTLALNWAGAAVSLSLVVGLSVWAWQLTMRDVSGVPVIRALEGPMRIAPEDPGGSQADHQGLAVNRIAAGEEAEPAAERIVLAPAPVELAELDFASASTPEASTAEANGAEALPTPDAASAATLELFAALQAGVSDAETALDGAQTAPATGLARSPRPTLRPADRRVASVATANDADPVAAASLSDELDPAGLPEGTRLVQLGAFDDLETARREWARLSGAFPDFFNGRPRVVQSAVSGGREFIRLRAAGFDDLSDARRFCTALLAEGTACIPVTVR